MSIAMLLPVKERAEPTVIGEARKAAQERFAESGWPTRRMENWRFTNLKPLIDTRFTPASAGDEDSAGLAAHLGTLPQIDSDHLVFINGRFSQQHSKIGSLPSKAFVGTFTAWAQENLDLVPASLASKDGSDHALVNLNTAFFVDGPALIVPAGVSLPRPIFIVFWNESSGASAIHLRSKIQLGAGVLGRCYRELEWRRQRLE